MKPTYEKLLHEFTKQKIFAPKNIRFDFSVLPPHPQPEYRDIDFIDTHKIFFSSYSKCLSHQDISRLFEKLSRDIEGLNLESNLENDERAIQILFYLEKLIACVKDEKMWLHFVAQEKLIELLENTTNPKVIFYILKLFFSFLKTKLRVHELFLFNLKAESKIKLVVLVQAWILGVNLCNSKDIANFNEKFQLRDKEAYLALALNPKQIFNEEINLEKLTSITNRDLKLQPKVNLNLLNFENLTISEIMDLLSEKMRTKIHFKSLNMKFIKIRQIIFDNIFPISLSGERQFSEEGHQRICLLSLIATNIIKSINKNSELFETVKNCTQIFDEYALERNDEFAIDSLDSVLPNSFVDSGTFRNTMIFIFNYYVYMNDSTIELNDKLKDFLCMILERIAKATYLQNKVTSVSEIDLRFTNFPVTNENIIEILRIVNLFYINESKIRSFNSDYSNLFDVIICLQTYYNQEIKNNFSEEILQILLEINRLMMNELEKDKDMVLLDLFVDNLKFYLEIYSLYRSQKTIRSDIYDNFLLLLFETIEAIDSYFIDPLKSQFLFNIPRVARMILESNFWQSESLFQIMAHDDHFLFIFNELVVLLNDLLNEVAENYLLTFINKFIQNGLFKIIFERFGKQCVSNEYDSLGFLVNLLSKIHLHSKLFFTLEEIEHILKYFTEQLILKEALLSNLKRFNASDSHLALKNFSEELIELCNVHPNLIDTLMRVVIQQIRLIRIINNQICEMCFNIDTQDKLISIIRETNLIAKQFGWFQEPLSYSEIIDDLVLWQKAIFNYIKFLIKFFDNHKTNVYQNFIKLYDEEFGTENPFLDFIFENCNLSFIISDFSKQKKLGALLLKTSLLTNNQMMVKMFREYLLKRIPNWQKELTQVSNVLSESQFACIAETLQDKNRTHRENVALNFECIGKEAQKFQKNYTNIAMGLECIRFLASNSRDVSNVNDFFRYFMNLQKSIMQADQKLVICGGDVFFKMLFEELENQSFEYFFTANRNQAFHSLQGFYKVLKYLRENSNIETLYELTTRIIRSKITLEGENQNFPTFFITQFASVIDKAIQSPILDSYSLVIIYFHINCLQEFMNLKKTFYDNYLSGSSSSIESMYYLSKIGFFSRTLIGVIRFVINFIAKNQKTLKYLFKKRKTDNELFTKDIIRLFIMDEILAKLLKAFCLLVEKLFEIKQVNFSIKLSDGTIADETFIVKVFEVEKITLLKEIIAFLKSITPESFYCLELEEKIDNDDESSLKKIEKLEKAANSKGDQKNPEFKTMSLGKLDSELTSSQQSIPFKLEKTQALVAFLSEYENFFLFLFKVVCKSKIELLPDIAINDQTNKKINFFELGNLSSNEFANKLLDMEISLLKIEKTKLTEEQILNYKYNNEESDPASDMPFKEKFTNLEYYKEIASKNPHELFENNQKNLESLVIHFFTNFMKYKEGKKVLKQLWKFYDTFKRNETNQTANIISSMFEATQQNLRSFMNNGKFSRSKSEWKLLIKEKDPLYYLLALQVDLLNLMPSKEAKDATKTYANRLIDSTKPENTRNSNLENSNNKLYNALRQNVETPHSTTPVKTINDTVLFLTGILEEQLQQKQRRSHLQELAKAILELLTIADKSHDDKILIIRSIFNLLKLHKIWFNSKERTVLINGTILKSVLSLLIIIFHEDELFLEKLASTPDFKIFKSLLRIKAGKISANLTIQINSLFKALIELIIRQPHIICLLYESELKSFLFKQPEKQYDLTKLIEVFGKLARENEKIFVHVFHKVCEIVYTSKNVHIARLAKNQEFTVRNSDIKPFVIEFVSILMHDSILKINQRIQKPELDYIFNHLMISEALFFQILPRYPLFYSLNFPKEKLLFVVHYFEKAIQAHPGYFNFLQPLFFESPLLVKDPNGILISVTKMIRSEIIAFLMNYVKKLKDKFESDCLVNNPISNDLLEGDAKNQTNKIEDTTFLLLNVIMFVLQASKSENFNQEMSKSELPNFLIECYEEIFSSSINSQKFNKNNIASLIALPEIMRRRQVIVKMNEEEIKGFEKRAIDVLLLNVPTTFRVSLEKWQTQRQKLSFKDYNIRTSLDINYTFFNQDQKPDLNNIYRIEENFNRTRGQRHLQTHMTVFRPVFEEDNPDQNDEAEFWQDRGLEEQEQDSDGASWQSEPNENPTINFGNPPNLNVIGFNNLPPINWDRINQQILNIDVLRDNIPQLQNTNVFQRLGNEMIRTDFMNININPQNQINLPPAPHQALGQVPLFHPLPDSHSSERSLSRNRMDIEEQNEESSQNDLDENEQNEDNENEISEENEEDESSDNAEEESENSENERLDSDQSMSSDNEDEIMMEIGNEIDQNIDDEEDEDDDENSEESDIRFMEEPYDEDFNQSYNDNSDPDNLSREFENQRLERQNAEPNHALNISSKIFSTYPFALPLNLTNIPYLYYNDSITEEYKEKLSERVLPFIGSRNEQIFKNQQKEFKNFKSDFYINGSSKIKDRLFNTQLDYHSNDSEARAFHIGFNGRPPLVLGRDNQRILRDNFDRFGGDLRRNNPIFNSLDIQLEGLFNDLGRLQNMRRGRLNIINEENVQANRSSQNPVIVSEVNRPHTLLEEILKTAVVINENPKTNTTDSQNNNTTVKTNQGEALQNALNEEKGANQFQNVSAPSPFLKKHESEIVNEDACFQSNLELIGHVEETSINQEHSQIPTNVLADNTPKDNLPIDNDDRNKNPVINELQSNTNQDKGMLIEQNPVNQNEPSKLTEEAKIIEESKDNSEYPTNLPTQPIQSLNNQINLEPINSAPLQVNLEPREETISENKFNFAALGLPDNFLEIADIDATFFNALPLEIQTETVLMIGSELNLIQPNIIPRQPETNVQNRNNQNNSENESVSNENRSRSSSHHQEMLEEQNNNLLFISSLSPEIREEVLMTCPDEFLMSLPENIQAEARNLRDNAYIANWNQNQDEERMNNNANAGNLATNRIKKAIKKNKQRDAIRKTFFSSEDPHLYQASHKIIEAVITMLSDSEFSLKNLPIGYISSLLFNSSIQQLFFEKMLSLIESNNRLLQSRALTLIEILCYSNFQYFHSKSNFDRFLLILGEQKINEKLIYRFLKSINHILKTALNFDEKSETCDIIISPLNLSHLTSVLHCKQFDFSEPLSMILFLLSFSHNNLDLIVSNLQENIDRFAFNLNLKLIEILEDQIKTNASNEASLLLIGKKIVATYDAQVRLLKIFKLLEQLFKRSFSQIFKQTETNELADGKEKAEKFDMIKQRVLTSFSNYFNQKNIRRVFVNLFKVLKFYESNIDKIISKKQVSKPAFLKLLPLVESFFTIYKLLCDDDFLKTIKQNLRLTDNAVGVQDVKAAEYTEHLSEASDIELLSQQSHMSDSKSKPTFCSTGKSTEISEITIQVIFNNASKSNKNILNYFLSQTSKVSQSPLAVLIRHSSRVVNFDIKRKYFSQSLQTTKSGYMLRIVVRRANLFQDSYNQIQAKSGSQMRGKLHIRFQDEEGEDAGGVQREWFNSLSHEIFNPNYALFIPASHGYAYQPSAFSYVNSEHLHYFKFIGKIVGKALFDGQLLDVHFTRSFYKHMTGTPLNYLDFEDYDPEYFRTLKWILENDVDDLEMDFSYQQDIFGKKEIKELKPNGRNIAVTNANKAEYIRLICEVKMTEEIRTQIQAFLEGLHSVIPHDMLKIFDPKELELMISGLPEIDLADLRENTEYVNYTKDSVVIRNFWDVLQGFDENLKAGFLQFVTGTSKVPFEGFQFLKGIGGAVQKFNIHKAYDTEKLPTTHTCMNQLDLPEYATKEELEVKLKKAILYGREGFGFI